MTLLIHNLSDDRILAWVELSQFPFQRGADKTTRRVSLSLEGVELLLQLDRKLNNNANKLGHDRDSLWAKYETDSACVHMLFLASITLTMRKY